VSDVACVVGLLAARHFFCWLPPTHQLSPGSFTKPATSEANDSRGRARRAARGGTGCTSHAAATQQRWLADWFVGLEGRSRRAREHSARRKKGTGFLWLC
jgi:hypothetical protein